MEVEENGTRKEKVSGLEMRDTSAAATCLRDAAGGSEASEIDRGRCVRCQHSSYPSLQIKDNLNVRYNYVPAYPSNFIILE